MARLDGAFLSEFFTETCTVKARTGRDQFGKPTYSAGNAHKCRWVKRDSMMHRSDGETVREDGELWIAPLNGALPSFMPDDMITLPDGETRRILSIEVYNEGIDLDHVKVLYGRLGQR